MVSLFSQQPVRQRPQATTIHTFLIRLIFLCVLPLGLLALILASVHVYTVHLQQDQNAQAQAHQVEMAIDQGLSAHIMALQVLAASSLMDDLSRLEEFYKETQAFREIFSGHVVVADLSSQMLLNTRLPFGATLPKLPVPKEFAAAPYVLETGKPAVADMFLGPIAKEPLVAVVVPVVRHGQTVAILLSIIETRQYQTLLDEFELSPGYFVTLRDSKGSLIAHRTVTLQQDVPGKQGFWRSFTTRSTVAHWSVVLEVSPWVYLKPLLIAGGALAMAILLVALASIVAGRVVGRQLTRALESLTESTSPRDPGLAICEIENVHTLLQEAAANRKTTLAELRENEARYRNLFEAANVGKVLRAVSGEIRVNKAFCDMLGYEQEELQSKTWQEITPPEDVEKIQQEIFDPMLQGEKNDMRFEKRFVHKNGSFLWTDVSISMQSDPQGKPLYFITTIVDITERIKLERQLVQTKKMEAVGQLAGGVAHDYNNMLSVIMGYTEMALQATDPTTTLHGDLTEVMNAARRSAEITRQLLAFARKQIVEPKILDLNMTVEGMLKMIRRLIGEDLELVWLPGDGVWSVNMDPSQLDQILVNLCVNARDAIADVGHVTIETQNMTFDEEYCAEHDGFRPGDFALLMVSDDGCGMNRELVEKIFEPFFTTKKLGEGTGLGLSTVYGIVKQNLGFINVYSEPGEGTTIKVYLPRHASMADTQEHRDPEDIPRANGETILLVEDEESILVLGQRMLAALGYTVLIAGSPEEAITLARTTESKIDLLITDVIMPGMNGRVLAEQLQAVRPTIKVLYMSGYTANVIAHHGVLNKGVHFVPKPLSRQLLATKVREALV